jgi:hypothetical protein
MKLKSVLKLGCAALIASSTMLAPKPAQAAHTAALCIYSYTQSNGDVCTYSGLEGHCCTYTSSGSGSCPKICNV